jgi:hypothetical protein
MATTKTAPRHARRENDLSDANQPRTTTIAIALKRTPPTLIQLRHSGRRQSGDTTGRPVPALETEAG